MARVKLGDLLRSKGLISQEQLEVALAEQKASGLKVGQILMANGYIAEEQISTALADHFRLERADLDAAVAPAVLQVLDSATCEKHVVVPLQILPSRNTLVLAVADPTDVVTIDELSFKVGMRIDMRLASEREIRQAIDRLYHGRVYRAPQDKAEAASRGKVLTSEERLTQLEHEVERLQAHQRRVAHAVKVLAELGISAGTFERDDYLAMLKTPGASHAGPREETSES